MKIAEKLLTWNNFKTLTIIAMFYVIVEQQIMLDEAYDFTDILFKAFNKCLQTCAKINEPI